MYGYVWLCMVMYGYVRSIIFTSHTAIYFLTYALFVIFGRILQLYMVFGYMLYFGYHTGTYFNLLKMLFIIISMISIVSIVYIVYILVH